MADLRSRKFCENGHTSQGWLEQGVHFLILFQKNGQDCCWVMTHRDEADIEGSWSLPGETEDVYEVSES